MTIETPTEDSSATETNHPGPATLLSEAREKLGLSQKEVADKLFLTTTFIKYIDDGEFDRIPKPAFVKGYLRSYARVVELSGDDIVALYEAQIEAKTPTPEIRGVTEEEVGTASITGPVFQTGVIGLAGLVGVIALVWYLVSDDSDSHAAAVPSRTENPATTPVPSNSVVAEIVEVADASSETSTEQDSDAESGMPNGVEPAVALAAGNVSPAALDNAEEPLSAAGDDAADETPAVSSIEALEDAAAIPNETPEAENTSAAVQDESSQSENEPIKFERTSDGERNYVSVDAGGFDQLVLSFDDECWVEIEDQARGRVYNDLNRDGDVLTVYGTAPFQVLLGKATGVEMIYNGRPFDLASRIGDDNTAKLTVAD